METIGSISQNDFLLVLFMLMTSRMYFTFHERARRHLLYLKTNGIFQDLTKRIIPVHIIHCNKSMSGQKLGLTGDRIHIFRPKY